MTCRKWTRLCLVAYLVVTCHALDSWHPLLNFRSKGNSSDPATTAQLREHLLKWRWTAFIGDSILLAQFLTLSEELQAQPEESELSQFQPCAVPSGVFPTDEAMAHFALKPNEHMLSCYPSGCIFQRLGCLNLFKTHCMEKYCHAECQDTQVWDAATAAIQRTIAQPDSFVVTFHWAPTHLETPKVYERLDSIVPGAILWNNCMHWFGHTPVAQEEVPQQLQKFLGYVKTDANLLKQIMGGQTLAFQGCSKKKCLSDPRGQTVCELENQNLVEANAQAKQLVNSMGIMFVDIQPVLTDAVVQAAFPDNNHPCFPVPCMWTQNLQHAPRQTCASLLVNSLDEMNAATAGATAGGWDTPTFLKLGGVHGDTMRITSHSEQGAGRRVEEFREKHLESLHDFLGVTPPPNKPAQASKDISVMLPCNIEGVETLWPWYLCIGMVFLILIVWVGKSNLQADEEPQVVEPLPVPSSWRTHVPSTHRSEGTSRIFTGRRSAFLDNARFAHMALVVASHAIHTTMFGIRMDNPRFWLYGFWVWISFFNLPLLAFISGVMSKGELTQERLGKLLVYVLMPYILFKLIWWVIYMVAQQRLGMFNPLSAFAFVGIEWYLAALFMWRLLLGVFRPLWPSVLLSISLVMGLSAGYLCRQSAAFALSPMLSYWPLFIGGFLVDAVSLERFLTQRSVRMCGGVVVVSTLLACSVFKEQLESTLLYPGFVGDLNTDYQSYYTVQQIPQTFPIGCGEATSWLWVYRLMRYVLVVVLGFSFLSLMPQTEIKGTFDITACGSRTLYAYLLHMLVLWLIILVLQAILPATWLSTSNTFLQGGWIWGALVIGSVFLNWFLSTKWVAGVAWPLVEPTWVEYFVLPKRRRFG